MSTTPRPPLLSDDALLELTYVKEDGRRPSEQVRDYYEAARAKDAEEIAKWKGIVKGVHGALTDIGTVPVPAIDADLYDAVMSIRAKDAELIQRLVYWLHRVKSLPDVDSDERCWMGDDALAAAAAAGFKPSEP